MCILLVLIMQILWDIKQCSEFFIPQISKSPTALLRNAVDHKPGNSVTSQKT